MKLRATQYLGYAAGDAANNLTFSMISAFLLIYYTDVAGIAAGTAGTIFLVVRIWGGFTDLLAGRVVDETSTRWGRFRPYLLFGSVPLLVLLVAVFSIPGGLSDNGALVWACVSYALFQLAYSFVNIPYGSLSAAMTQEPDDARQAVDRPDGRGEPDHPDDRGRRLAPDLGQREPAELADDHHDRVRDRRVRVLHVVLRHGSGDGEARRAAEGHACARPPTWCAATAR